MANIQNPNGFEANETIDGVNDIMHIFQPGSSGTRRNKRIILNTLKVFFQFITGGTLNNIVTIGSSEELQDSGVAVADVGTNTTHRTSDGKDHSDVVLNNTHRSSDGKNHSDVVLNNTHRSSNGSDHTFIDQDVKVAAGPTFNGGIQTDGTKLRTKVIDAGTWNMDTASQIIIAHGLDYTKIIHVKGIVEANDGVRRYRDGFKSGTGTSDVVQLWIGYIDTTNVRFVRTTTGFFDDSAFNAAPVKITIEYEA